MITYPAWHLGARGPFEAITEDSPPPKLRNISAPVPYVAGQGRGSEASEMEDDGGDRGGVKPTRGRVTRSKGGRLDWKAFSSSFIVAE